MSFKVDVLADSISPDGVRLTTFETTFPRFILAEWNTHRVFSRNSASSRAIPTEKIIERVKTDPFVPMTFNKRVKGMGVGNVLDQPEAIQSRRAWMFARDKAVQAAHILMEMDVDKSRVNRLLEPFMWHTVITTATEWDNFFALRNHEGAQPEFRHVAQMMAEAYNASEPAELNYGEWHLPLVDLGDEWIEAAETGNWEWWAKVCAGRCARSSYDLHHDFEEDQASVERAEKLQAAGHMSPFEHAARPFSEDEAKLVGRMRWPIDDSRSDYDIHPEVERAFRRQAGFLGNLKGWVSYRKLIPWEHSFADAQAEATLA